MSLIARRHESCTIGSVLQDIRHAFRLLRLNPGFSLIAILTMALGIGANTALFSVIDAVILKPLPFTNPDRLVMLWDASRDFTTNVVSPANYLDWKARNTVFDAMSPVIAGTESLSGVGEPEEIQIQRIGEQYFPLLGIRTTNGRSFTVDDTKQGSTEVAILSNSLWRRKYSSDPSIVGKAITVGGLATTVIGIAPAGLMAIGDRRPEIWLPARLLYNSTNGVRNSGHFMLVIARLKPGISTGSAQAEMKRIASQLEREYPESNTNWTATVQPLADAAYGDVRTPLWILFGAVGCVLLIACSNVANLLLTRAVGRSRELAIRLSVGASQARIIRQLLIEGTTLAALGGIFGLLLAVWLIEGIKLWDPSGIRRLETASLDLRVLVFTLAATMIAGLLLGLVPAFSSARQALAVDLRDGGRSTTGTSIQRFRDAFTIAQIALSLILLCGGGLLIRSFTRLISVNPGFDAENVLTMELNLPDTRYREQVKQVDFFRRLNERMHQLPGVRSASVITGIPFSGRGFSTYFSVDGRPAPAPGQEPIADVRMIHPGYFETMKIPLKRGRLLSESDNRPESPLVYIVNETTARVMFPNEDPIGKRLIVQAQQNKPGEIIGVVGDIRPNGLDSKIRSMMYCSQAKLSFGFASLVIRTSVPPETLTQPVKAVVHDLDPELPISEVRTMQGWIDQSVARPKFQTTLLTAFAGLALLLAVIGIYGVMSYSVTQRLHEIGIRLALGAKPSDVRQLVLSKGLRLAAAGIAIGLVGALLTGKWIEKLLFEIKPADPLVLCAVSATLLLAAFTASSFPARRATKVDPMVALRHD